tara:strand:- start:82 stop:240 length:159 start_codon:yes stop_codon:yes gene_type:complete
MKTDKPKMVTETIDVLQFGGTGLTGGYYNSGGGKYIKSSSTYSHTLNGKKIK